MSKKSNRCWRDLKERKGSKDSNGQGRDIPQLPKSRSGKSTHTTYTGTPRAMSVSLTRVNRPKKEQERASTIIVATISGYKRTHESNLSKNDKEMTNMVDSMAGEVFHGNEIIKPAIVGLDNLAVCINV